MYKLGKLRINNYLTVVFIAFFRNYDCIFLIDLYTILPYQLLLSVMLLPDLKH